MLGIHVLPAIVLFVVLSLLYTYIGGVKAVIWTDAVQFGLFLLGGIFALCYIPSLSGGGGGGFSQNPGTREGPFSETPPPPEGFLLEIFFRFPPHPFFGSFFGP